MIDGYIFDNEAKARPFLGAIRAAIMAGGQAEYWTPGLYPVFSGPNAGKVFVPWDDNIKAIPLVFENTGDEENPRRAKTIEDFPAVVAYMSTPPFTNNATAVSLDPSDLSDSGAEV